MIADVWTQPDGRRVLADVETFLSRFVAFPSEAARVATVLWAAHTHVIDCFDSTPRIAFLSPEPGSGKTRALEVLELLVPRPVTSVNVTPAYLFRKVSDEAGPPVILFDEIDTVFGPKAKDNEDVRGLLNAGHRRGATAGRCVVRGKEVFTEELPAFAAVAMAGLGDLPDTLMTRSVVVRMRRRAPTETVEPFRLRLHSDGGHAIRDNLADWTSSVRGELADTWPEMPTGIVDRNADVWEPLLAVADAAGGPWPDRARVTAVTHVTAAQAGGPSASLGIRLLTDIKSVFDERISDKLPTATLLAALHDLDEAPWGDLRGKPLDARGLARRLSAYGVRPTTLRDGTDVFKGYNRTDLHDPWERYVPTPAKEPVTSVTSATPARPTLVPQLNGSPHGQTGEDTQKPHPCDVCSKQLAEVDLLVGATVHSFCSLLSELSDAKDPR